MAVLKRHFSSEMLSMEDLGCLLEDMQKVIWNRIRRSMFMPFMNANKNIFCCTIKGLKEIILQKELVVSPV